VIEPISKSSEEDNEAGELDEAEKVVGVVFPADEDATLPLYPSEEALSFCQRVGDRRASIETKSPTIGRSFWPPTGKVVGEKLKKKVVYRRCSR
jgi:hypothetical protein